jgi:alpha-glucosidase (family GH31 glycosyl hydrolase)
MHLNATLVAPLEETETVRSVWLPPGEWTDAWSGEVLHSIA